MGWGSQDKQSPAAGVSWVILGAERRLKAFQVDEQEGVGGDEVGVEAKVTSCT